MFCYFFISCSRISRRIHFTHNKVSEAVKYCWLCKTTHSKESQCSSQFQQRITMVCQWIILLYSIESSCFKTYWNASLLSRYVWMNLKVTLIFFNFRKIFSFYLKLTLFPIRLKVSKDHVLVSFLSHTYNAKEIQPHNATLHVQKGLLKYFLWFYKIANLLRVVIRFSLS